MKLWVLESFFVDPGTDNFVGIFSSEERAIAARKQLEDARICGEGFNIYATKLDEIYSASDFNIGEIK